MEKELVYAPQHEPASAPQEVVPESFPIIEDSEIYYFDDKPDLTEGEIIHYLRSSFREKKKWNRFALLKTIGGLHYTFSFSETFDDQYQLSFQTQEYELAITNLDADTRNQLFATISAFVESALKYTHNAIKEIRISPARASYSAEEIKQCTDAILASPKNTLTRAELTSEYKGFEIFDLYQELFGNSFHSAHYNFKSKAHARSRLFKMISKKYAQNWEIVQEDSIGGDFILRQKN